MRAQWVAFLCLTACGTELQDPGAAPEGLTDRRRPQPVLQATRVEVGNSGTVTFTGGAPRRAVVLGFAEPGNERCFANGTCEIWPAQSPSGGPCQTNTRGVATCTVSWSYSLVPGSTARAWQVGVRGSLSNVLALDVAYCGDWITDGGEGCDDGNTWDYDGCSSWCQIEYAQCGNGQLEYGEECDDGNPYDGDGCSSDCRWAYYAVCGNGSLEPYEACDDGNNSDYDGCDQYCGIETNYGFCGDGYIQSGEDCDDGGNSDGDGCTSDCHYGDTWSCGNGVVEGYEACDDGNQDYADGCDPSCNFDWAP